MLVIHVKIPNGIIAATSFWLLIAVVVAVVVTVVVGSISVARPMLCRNEMENYAISLWCYQHKINISINKRDDANNITTKINTNN